MDVQSNWVISGSLNRVFLVALVGAVVLAGLTRFAVRRVSKTAVYYTILKASL
jgi:hypothetical protein